MNPDDKLVETCKELIRYRAGWARIGLKEEDIVVFEHEDKTAVFLRRQFLGYEENEDGILILDENFEPIPVYKPLVWYETLPEIVGMSSAVVDEKWKVNIAVTVPELVCLTPWLIFVIKDGEIKSQDFWRENEVL